jgi:hypothetical protein
MSSVQRNNVKISGNGSKIIMFAHGYGCDQNMWRGVAPSFAEHFKVVLSTMSVRVIPTRRHSIEHGTAR